MSNTSQSKSAALAARIVKRLIRDATDRRGWRQEWEGFEDYVQREIRRTWRRIVLEEIKRKSQKR